MPPDPPAPVVCFLDESATDANDSDFAVLGGLVMNRRDIPEFETAWRAVLARHGLPALHMIDLGPTGPYPTITGDACRAMLADVVQAVNRCRIFSFGATWDNRAHETLFSPWLRRRHFSVYGLIFLMAVEINRASAARQGYRNVIDYVLDDGNRFKRQIDGMHKAMKGVPELAKHMVGSLTFDTDSNVLALQAADVVVWATRRKFSGKGLTGVHEPLEHLFDPFYVHSPAPPKLIRKMAARFAVAEANVDPDAHLGRLLLNRRPLFCGALIVGVVLAALSLWFSSLFAWSAAGTVSISVVAAFAASRRLKRR